MIVYLHSNDVSDAGRTFGRHHGQDVLHVRIPSDTPVSQAAEVVRSAAGNVREAIDLLVINTYCSPGRIHLGGIEDDTYDVNERNAEVFAAPFAPMLKPTNKGGQGVEIQGGSVAASNVDPRTGEVDDPDLGFRFLYLLACAFGQKVAGTASPQVSESEGLFEDDIVIAVPDHDLDGPDPVSRITDSKWIPHGNRSATRMDEFFTALTWEHPREQPRAGEGSPTHSGWNRR